MKPRFGPAGCPDDFAAAGYASAVQMPAYLAGMGLDAFEYQCGRGVRVSTDTANRLREAAKAADIELSVHAPYFISMSGIDEEKRLRSVDYILQSAKAVHAMGGNRVVVHSGSRGKLSRAAALDLAKDTMRKAVRALDEAGLSEIRICPETMGKINQLGTLEEVIALCETDERLTPCVDFGHLNARTGGAFCEPGAYQAALDAIENALGAERLRRFHIHFSKIEYTAGGEKRHLTFADTVYGPPFEPLIDALLRKRCAPVIICESSGTQGEDARTMKRYYERQAGNRA